MAHEQTTTGPSVATLERIERAQYGAFIHAEVVDPQDLGYVQFGWAMVRWLLDATNGAVLDTIAGRWWTRDEIASWEGGGWPSGRRFLLQREVNFPSGPSDNRWVLSTEGLAKFGRPDLLCMLAPDELNTATELATASIPAWGPEVMDQFATKMALGAQFQAGDQLQLGSLKFTVETCKPGVNAPMEVGDAPLVLAHLGAR